MTVYVEKAFLKNMATEELKNSNPAYKEFQSLLDQDLKIESLKKTKLLRPLYLITKNFVVVIVKLNGRDDPYRGIQK